MRIEEFLDLAGIDVLSAPDNHVLDAADDVAISLRVDRRDVAGVHPSLGIDGLGSLLRVVPIAFHDGIAARAEFAGKPGRQRLAAFTDDLDLAMRLDTPDRRHAAVDGIAGTALEGNRRRLGHAIG